MLLSRVMRSPTPEPLLSQWQYRPGQGNGATICAVNAEECGKLLPLEAWITVTGHSHNYRGFDQRGY
jgi:hypothetical protein